MEVLQEIYAALAHKYKVVCMRDFVDGILRQVITHEKALVPEVFSGLEVSIFLSATGLVCKFSTVAVKFELPASKEASVEYFQQIVQGIKKGAEKGHELCHLATGWVSECLDCLSSRGYDEFANRLAKIVLPMLHFS